MLITSPLRKEQLLQLPQRIIRILDRMPHCPLILINLPIIAPLIRLIPKEMYRRKVDTIVQLLIRLDMAQAIRLVPARGKHIEGDLPADGIRESDVGKGLFELGDHGGADVVLLVVGFVFVAFGCGRVTADGGHVDHAVAEFDEGAALDGDVEVGDVVQDPRFVGRVSYHLLSSTVCVVDVPFYEALVLLLANPSDEARARELLAQPVRCESVFREAKVEEGGYVDGAADLLLLLDHVGAADVADGDFVAEFGQELQHLGLDELGGVLGAVGEELSERRVGWRT